jgi:hypothetical protein
VALAAAGAVQCQECGDDLPESAERPWRKAAEKLQLY